MKDGEPLVLEASVHSKRTVASRAVIQIVLEVDISREHDVPKVCPHDGWVAIARLDRPKGQMQAKPPNKWVSLSATKQAGIRCADAVFHKFVGVRSEEEAVKFVRHHCGVASRAELDSNIQASTKWRDLDEKFQAWLHADEHGAG